MPDTIIFYGALEGYSAFSNFHPAPIRIGGRTYPTSEHYFQACKAETREECEAIRKAGNPAQAKRMGRKVKLRKDWESIKVKVMRVALRAKFTQHKDLKDLLLSTGDAVIHEDAPKDAVWGWMGGSGQDLLGKLLMELRDELRNEA
jgi:ribA/ribD-fused uncharacterized protein